MKTTNWFIERGLKTLSYQEKVLDDIKQSMSSQEVTILAACPSAGKTIMSIFTIENYLNQHPTHKVLVLTHGTTILRTQFCEVLDEVKPGFTSNLVEKYNDYNSNKQVNVCLPQTLSGHTLSHVDLLVVDESHQFYFADMVQDIIKQTTPSKQLLLTGTPSIFIQKNYPIIPIPLMTIYEEGMVADVRVEIATSSYNFDIIKDYNEDKELKSEVEFVGTETKKTLDELLTKIVAKLSNNKSIRTWSQTLTELKKTMFACRTQKQAIQVKQYFEAIGINSALSISDTDSNSSEIQRFKSENSCLILIVVGRGILGFNYTRLVNIVDMTTSQNIDRIYQLFSRVVRKHPDGDKKLFFKIAPNGKSEYYKYIMSGVLALTSEEFFTKYNGKNFDDLKIPVIKVKAEKKNLSNYKTKNSNKKYEPVNFSDLPVFEFFKNVYNDDKTLNTYTLANIADVRAEFLSRKPLGFWTIDKCMKSAKSHGTPITWKIEDFEAYQASKYYGWYNECIKHMTMIYHLQTVCMRTAQKYSNVKDWQKKDKSSYDIAVEYDWLQECTEHMLINA
jgi:superfamily II DNA or RNA helicase